MAQEHDDDSDDLEVGEVELPGSRTDRFGNKFTIPTDSQMSDISDDPLAVPYKEPGYYYQYEDGANVPTQISRGFQTVTRRQAGFTTTVGLPSEYGVNDPLDSPHKVGSLFLIKAPQEVYDSIDRKRALVAKAAVAPILRPKAGGENPESSNVIMDETRSVTMTASRINK